MGVAPLGIDAHVSVQETGETTYGGKIPFEGE